MTFYVFIAVGLRTASGAWLRWGNRFNCALLERPSGMLCANLICPNGFLFLPLLPEWRLRIIAIIFGGLTTFFALLAATVTRRPARAIRVEHAPISAHLSVPVRMAVPGMNNEVHVNF